MSTAQVGAGAVAIFPTFKGFRRGVASEVDGVTRESGTRFTKGFSTAGTTAGRGFSEGFKRQTSSVSGDALKKATDEVAKASRELATVRLKEQDATGKVRVAEAGLADVRRRYADDSVQVVRAQERLAAAQRQVLNIQENVENSTERLSRAKRDLADASKLAADGSGGRGWRGAFGGFGNQAADGFTSRFRSRVGEIFTGNFLAGVALSIGRTIVRGAVQGIQTGIQFAYDGIGLASDLGESLNAAQVAFGEEIGEQLRILADTAPTRLALTRRAFLQFSTQFSAFAKVIRRDNPAAFIDQLTERGADFASVFNLEVSEALEVFQSGLAGQTEPLRKYGLDLSAASVNAYAWANGITAQGKALTENEKIQARWGLLLEQTSVVQGDNANTSDQLAGQQRRLAVAFEEAQTKLGEYLIPGFLSLVTVANERVLPLLGGLIDRVGPKLGQALEAVDWGRLANALAPVLEDVIDLAAEEGIPALTRSLETFSAQAPIWIERFDATGKALAPLIEHLVNIGGAALFAWDAIVNPSWLVDDTAMNRLTYRAQEGIYGPMMRDLLGFGADWDREWAITSNAPQNYFQPGEFVPTDTIDEAMRAGLRATRSGLSSIGAEFDREAADNLRPGGGGGYDWGVSVGQGIERGLNASRGFVGRAASNLANEVKNQARFTLQINSPSKVMREVGRFAGDGMALGLRDSERDVVAAARSVAALVPAGAATASQSLSGASSGQLVVYVENPWTGEEMLARARLVAGDVVREGKASTAAAVAGGVLR